MNTRDVGVRLSPAGLDRRDAILRSAQAALRGRRRRREAARILGFAAPAVVLLVAIGLAIRGGASHTIAPGKTTANSTHPNLPVNLPGSRRAPDSARPLALRTLTVEEVATQPGIAERLASAPTPQVSVLDDDELIAALKDMGRPTGLIRTPGSVVLTAHVAANLPEAGSGDEDGTDGPTGRNGSGGAPGHG